MPHSGLTKDGSDIRYCYWYHKTAIGHAIGKDVTSDVTWHGDRAAFFINNTTGAVGTSAGIWGSEPTSSLIGIGANDQVPYSGDFVCYAFTRTPGLIGVGAYTGNASADGPCVVVDDGGAGFRPAWLLVKNASSAQGWCLHDAARSPHNVMENMLRADDAQVEAGGSARHVDFTASGFKIRTADDQLNGAGDTMIYLAFAAFPFGGEGVAQARAR